MSKRAKTATGLVLASLLLWTGAVVVAESSAEDQLDSLLYRVVSTTSGGTIHVRGASFELPAGYRVLDVKRAANWVWLTVAYEVLESHRFVSEFWQVEYSRAAGTVDLDSRRVLASYDLLGGERMTLCHSVAVSESASALFVQYMEGGRTQIYDTAGTEVEVKWPTWLPGYERQVTFDCIRPIAWIGSYSEEQRLVCLAFADGGEPYLVLANPGTGEAELGTAASLFAKVGNDLLVECSNYRW